jgi:membrane fusion protein (multidrug efflux system)
LELHLCSTGRLIGFRLRAEKLGAVLRLGILIIAQRFVTGSELAAFDSCSSVYARRGNKRMSMKKFDRNYLRWGLPVLIIIFMMLWLGGSFHRGNIQPGKVKAAETSASGVPLYTVSMQTAPQVTEAVGTVQPQFKTTVSARVVANIVELPVAAGQRVRKGDLLVRLDDRDLRAKRQQAQEALRRDEATRDLAQSDYERDKALFEKQVIPKSEFDQTALRLKTSTADVAGLQQAEHDATVTLGYAVIRSPYEGIVVDKLSDVGDLATPGKPLLTLYESGRLWLEAAVPEEQAGEIHIGKSYQVRLDSLDKVMSGRLVEIVPSADSSSRTITARVTIPHTENVFPGLFGRMLIPVGERERVMIPQSAVLRVGQLTMVDVDESGTLRRRSVQVGRQIGNEIEILSGLVPGEKVSLDPRKELQP